MKKLLKDNQIIFSLMAILLVLTLAMIATGTKKFDQSSILAICIAKLWFVALWLGIFETIFSMPVYKIMQEESLGVVDGDKEGGLICIGVLLLSFSFLFGPVHHHYLSSGPWAHIGFYLLMFGTAFMFLAYATSKLKLFLLLSVAVSFVSYIVFRYYGNGQNIIEDSLTTLFFSAPILFGYIAFDAYKRDKKEVGEKTLV